MSAWTESEKESVVTAYVAANPTPDTSSEIMQGLAEELGKTINGLRMILVKAGVYVKVTPATSSSKAATPDGKEKPKRVTKAESIASLVETMTEKGLEIDDEILSKLTGKAAVYFKTVIEAVK